jgi:hypothetical protein
MWNTSTVKENADPLGNAKSLLKTLWVMLKVLWRPNDPCLKSSGDPLGNAKSLMKTLLAKQKGVRGTIWECYKTI